MPFLFVDYDHGLGGEKFCAGLSQSPECEPLEFTVFDNGRTKVKDLFNQEFLQLAPNVDPKQSHPTLYTIVPTHRHSQLARKILKDVRSIRIKPPADQKIWKYVVEQRMRKVLFTREPTQEYFLGLLKILKESAVDPDFIKKVNYNMYTIDIHLLSMGKEPTLENREFYLQKVFESRRSEIDHNHDLILDYELLVKDPDRVKSQIESTFGITVTGEWIFDYQRSFTG